MMSFKASFGYISLLLLFLFLSCSDDSSPIFSSDESIDDTINYTVSIPSMDVDTIDIMMSIDSWSYSDSVALLVPAIFADNPYYLTGNPILRNYSINSGEVEAIIDSITIGNVKSALLKFPCRYPPY